MIERDGLSSVEEELPIGTVEDSFEARVAAYCESGECVYFVFVVFIASLIYLSVVVLVVVDEIIDISPEEAFGLCGLDAADGFMSELERDMFSALRLVLVTEPDFSPVSDLEMIENYRNMASRLVDVEEERDLLLAE